MNVSNDHTSGLVRGTTACAYECEGQTKNEEHNEQEQKSRQEDWQAAE